MFSWLYVNIFHIVLPLECWRKEVRSYLPRSTINSFTPVPVQGKGRKHSLAHPHHSQERDSRARRNFQLYNTQGVKTLMRKYKIVMTLAKLTQKLLCDKWREREKKCLPCDNFFA